jgi:hypothetical protein
VSLVLGGVTRGFARRCVGMAGRAITGVERESSGRGVGVARRVGALVVDGVEREGLGTRHSPGSAGDLGRVVIFIDRARVLTCTPVRVPLRLHLYSTSLISFPLR